MLSLTLSRVRICCRYDVRPIPPPCAPSRLRVDDVARADRALAAVIGKRLLYRDIKPITSSQRLVGGRWIVMARLRIRLKLNEGRRGAPLSKLGKIAEQAEKFLRALAGDCEIETKSGEWLAVDFDNGSVSYDAEFQGDVNPAVANIFARNIESLADYDPDLRGIIPMLGSNTMQSQCFVSVLGNSVTVEIESSKIKLR